jgi:cytochrome c oxidase assembly factor CtaG
MMNGNITAQNWLTVWNWQPVVIIMLVILVAAYSFAMSTWRRKNHPEEAVRTSQVVLFALGLVTLFIALISPLNGLVGVLFTAHMIQHLLVSLVAAPLLVASIPGWLARDIFDHRVVATLWKWLTMPLVAGFLFNANIWLWHAPPMVAAMMMSTSIHLLSQLLYLITGIIFWWPLFGSTDVGWPPLNLAGKLLYLFLSDMPMVLLGAGLTFTPPLYQMYITTAQAFGISPAQDQQIGGLLMWIPGSIFFIVIASGFFLQWMLQQEQQQREAEREVWEEENGEEEEEEIEEHTKEKHYS